MNFAISASSYSHFLDVAVQIYFVSVCQANMADFSVVFFRFVSSRFFSGGSTSEADDVTKTRIVADQVTIIYRCLGIRHGFFGVCSLQWVEWSAWKCFFSFLASFRPSSTLTTCMSASCAMGLATFSLLYLISGRILGSLSSLGLGPRIYPEAWNQVFTDFAKLSLLHVCQIRGRYF